MKKYVIDVPGFSDYYQILGVEPGTSFSAMKKAYYARAKECHPDVNPDAAEAEGRFRNLVNAFDILSDPDKRRQYDVYLRRVAESVGRGEAEAFSYSPTGRQSIMDSLADDILEELIVANDVPRNATLQTLMRDLEQTESFITFREAKNLFAQNKLQQALSLLRTLCEHGGAQNIIHHYYLARCAEALRRWWLADKHYRICIAIGKRRVPIQYLPTVRCRLYDLRKKHCGVIGNIRNVFSGPPPRPIISTEDEMVDDTSRAIGQLLSAQSKRVGTDRQLK